MKFSATILATLATTGAAFTANPQKVSEIFVDFIRDDGAWFQ